MEYIQTVWPILTAKDTYLHVREKAYEHTYLTYQGCPVDWLLL